MKVLGRGNILSKPSTVSLLKAAQSHFALVAISRKISALVNWCLNEKESVQ